MRAKLGRVRDLWRYPVMGLQGERLQTAEIREAGVVGDHRYVFKDSKAGRVIDPVTYAHRWGETLAFPSMLDLRARFAPGDSTRLDIITPDGRVLSSGDPDFQTRIGETLGLPVKLMEFPQVAETRQRAGRALHLITTASLDSMKNLYAEGDFDPRRFRPNIVVSSRPERNGFAEESWVGETIRIGPELVLRVEKTKLVTNSNRLPPRLMSFSNHSAPQALSQGTSAVETRFSQVGRLAGWKPVSRKRDSRFLLDKGDD
ncbi:MAG: MOSC domain-containing protein [Thaumarchaeota archaeon]|nr:MAG: MOSC domain-containing protein [Nitrososphaerota archaeon]